MKLNGNGIKMNEYSIFRSFRGNMFDALTDLISDSDWLVRDQWRTEASFIASTNLERILDLLL